MNRASKAILREVVIQFPPSPFPADDLAAAVQGLFKLQPLVIRLPVRGPINRQDIGLFLSPVQLDAAGKKELTDGSFRQDDRTDMLLSHSGGSRPWRMDGRRARRQRVGDRLQHTILRARA